MRSVLLCQFFCGRTRSLNIMRIREQRKLAPCRWRSQVSAARAGEGWNEGTGEPPTARHGLVRDSLIACIAASRWLCGSQAPLEASKLMAMSFVRLSLRCRRDVRSGKRSQAELGEFHGN